MAEKLGPGTDVHLETSMMSYAQKVVEEWTPRVSKFWHIRFAPPPVFFDSAEHFDRIFAARDEVFRPQAYTDNQGGIHFDKSMLSGQSMLKFMQVVVHEATHSMLAQQKSADYNGSHHLAAINEGVAQYTEEKLTPGFLSIQQGRKLGRELGSFPKGFNWRDYPTHPLAGYSNTADLYRAITKQYGESTMRKFVQNLAGGSGDPFEATFGVDAHVVTEAYKTNNGWPSATTSRTQPAKNLQSPEPKAQPTGGHNQRT